MLDAPRQLFESNDAKGCSISTLKKWQPASFISSAGSPPPQDKPGPSPAASISLPSPQPFMSKQNESSTPVHAACDTRHQLNVCLRDGLNPLSQPRNGPLTYRTLWGATYRQLSSTQPEFSAAPSATQGGWRGGRANMLLPAKGASDGHEVVARLDPGPIKTTTLFRDVESANDGHENTNH